VVCTRKEFSTNFLNPTLRDCPSGRIPPAPCACRPPALPCPIPGSGETALRPPVKPRSTADMHACGRPLRWWCPLRLNADPALLPLGASRCPNHHRERAGGLGLTRQRAHEVRRRLRDENRRRHRVSPLSVRPEGRRSRLWGGRVAPAPAPGAPGHLGCETTALRPPLPSPRRARRIPGPRLLVTASAGQSAEQGDRRHTYCHVLITQVHLCSH
jgi:hypothetical protein